MRCSSECFRITLTSVNAALPRPPSGRMLLSLGDVRSDIHMNNQFVTTRENLSAAERLVREHLNITASGDTDAVGANVTSDYFNHRSADEPMEPRQHGPEGLRATIRWLHRAFAEMRFEFHGSTHRGRPGGGARHPACPPARTLRCARLSRRTSDRCCTSTRCPQFWGVWRKEGESSRRSEGGGSYSHEGSEEGRRRGGYWSCRSWHKPTRG